MDSSARHSHLAPEILPIDSALQPYHSSSDLQIAVVSEKEAVNNHVGLERRLEEGKEVMRMDKDDSKKLSSPEVSRYSCSNVRSARNMTVFGLATCFILAFLIFVPVATRKQDVLSDTPGNSTNNGTVIAW